MSRRVHDLTKAITAQSRDLAFVLVKQTRVTNRTKESRVNHGQSRDLRFRRSSNHGTKHGKHAAAITAAAFSIEGGREWKRPESIHGHRSFAQIRAALISTPNDPKDPTMTDTRLDPWQRPEDGFPKDAYFEAVAAALRAAGVHLNDWNREEDWEVNYEIADDVVAASPLTWAEHGLYVSWRCDQDDEPLTDGFTGLGWYWVPYSKPQAGGDFAKEFAINELAEPEDVAAAVWALLHPDAARTKEIQ